MAGNSAIYRLDSNGQNEGTAPANNKIEFNSGSTPDDKGRVVTTHALWIRDIAMHPNPKRSLNILQDTLAGTKEVTLAGFFRDPVGASATNSGLDIFDTWMDNKATNTSLKFGRFGLRLDDFPVHNFNPVTGGGYILHYLYAERPEDSPDEVGFVAKLYFNRPTTPT